jgi:hypothetical protein
MDPGGRIDGALAVVSANAAAMLLIQFSKSQDVRAVIPGWSEGPDLRCAIAHRGISIPGSMLRIAPE